MRKLIVAGAILALACGLSACTDAGAEIAQSPPDHESEPPAQPSLLGMLQCPEPTKEEVEMNANGASVGDFEIVPDAVGATTPIEAILDAGDFTFSEIPPSRAKATVSETTGGVAVVTYVWTVQDRAIAATRVQQLGAKETWVVTDDAACVRLESGK